MSSYVTLKEDTDLTISGHTSKRYFFLEEESMFLVSFVHPTLYFTLRSCPFTIKPFVLACNFSQNDSLLVINKQGIYLVSFLFKLYLKALLKRCLHIIIGIIYT